MTRVHRVFRIKLRGDDSEYISMKTLAIKLLWICIQVEVLSSMEKEMVSSVQHTGEYVEGENKVWIGVSRAEGSKCERCWNYSGQVGSFTEHPTLCGRCFNVIVANPPEPVFAAVIS